MRLKKTLVGITSLLLISSLFATEISNAVIAKILAVKVQEFFTQKRLEKINTYHVEVKKYRSNDFEGYYSQLREIAFQESFGGDEAIIKDDSTESWKWYGAVRRVAINHFREHLHQGTNLVDTYTANRDTFRKTLSGLSPASKKEIIAILANFQMGLTKAKGGEYQEVFTTYLKYYSPQQEVVYLKDNKSVTKLTASTSMTKHEEAQLILTEQFIDQEAATFILRRYREGGNALLAKYETLIGLIKEDLK